MPPMRHLSWRDECPDEKRRTQNFGRDCGKNAHRVNGIEQRHTIEGHARLCPRRVARPQLCRVIVTRADAGKALQRAENIPFTERYAIQHIRVREHARVRRDEHCLARALRRNARFIQFRCAGRCALKQRRCALVHAHGFERDRLQLEPHRNTGCGRPAHIDLQAQRAVPKPFDAEAIIARYDLEKAVTPAASVIAVRTLAIVSDARASTMSPPLTGSRVTVAAGIGSPVPASSTRPLIDADGGFCARLHSARAMCRWPAGAPNRQLSS